MTEEGQGSGTWIPAQTKQEMKDSGQRYRKGYGTGSEVAVWVMNQGKRLCRVRNKCDLGWGRRGGGMSELGPQSPGLYKGRLQKDGSL